MDIPVFQSFQFLFCFDFCVVIIFRIFELFSRLGGNNFKSEYQVHSVRPSIVFVFEKCLWGYKQKIGNWKLKQWFNSAARSVTSLYRCQFLSMKNGILFFKRPPTIRNGYAKGQGQGQGYQQSAMQMNRCRHLVPLYPYHATNYNYYNLITFNCVL